MWRDQFTFNCYTVQQMSVENLIVSVEKGRLKKVSTRKNAFSRWDVVRQSRFIEGLLTGQPQPNLFVDGSQKVSYILGGANIIDTLCSFCNDLFSLKSLLLNVLDVEGKRFSQLPSTLRYRILNFTFHVNVIIPGVSSTQRMAIYANIDRDNTRLSDYRQIVFPYTYSLLAKEYVILRDMIKEKKLPLGGHSDFEDDFCRMAAAAYMMDAQVKEDDFFWRCNIDTLVNTILEDYELTQKVVTNLKNHSYIERITQCTDLKKIFSFYNPWKRLSFLTAVALSDKSEIKKLMARSDYMKNVSGKNSARDLEQTVAWLKR